MWQLLARVNPLREGGLRILATCVRGRAGVGRGRNMAHVVPAAEQQMGGECVLDERASN